MNILFLSNIVTPYQLDLLEEMNSQDSINMYGYFLFSKEQNRDWSLNLPKYVKVADFSKKINDYHNIHDYIISNKIDKIIIGGYSLPMTLYITLISKIKNIDLFFWLERPINEKKGILKYLKEVYLKFVLQRSKKVFAIGNLALERYSKYHDNVINIPYCMNLERFYEIKRDSDKKKIKFLFSGQYIDRKNILNTIKSFKSIENENIELNIIGGGELQDKVSKFIVNDTRINDIGFVQPKDLSNIYAQNDIFLMPSKHDGWALVINEAMASSMPIISTNKVGAVVEYIEHKKNGYICDIDETSIKKGIEFYLENKELIEKHSIMNKSIIKSSNADVKNTVKLFLNEL